MVFGHCGMESLEAHRQKTAIKNSCLSLLAVCFGVVGCVSYTNNFKNMVNAPWMVAESQFTSDIDTPYTDNKMHTAIGIRSFAVYSETSDGKELITEKGWLIDDAYPIITWEQCLNSLREEEAKAIDLNRSQERIDSIKQLGGWDRCEVCDRSSLVVVSFTIVALVASGIALVYHILRIAEDSSFVKDMTVFAGGTAFICGAVAFGSFQKCFRANQDFYASLYSPNALYFYGKQEAPQAVNKGTYGVGMILVMIAFIFNAISLITTFLVPAPQDEEEVESLGDDSVIESDDDKDDIETADKEGVELTLKRSD